MTPSGIQVKRETTKSAPSPKGEVKETKEPRQPSLQEQLAEKTRQYHNKGQLSARGDSVTWLSALPKFRRTSSFWRRTDKWQGPDGDVHDLPVECLNDEDYTPLVATWSKGCSLCTIHTRHSEALCRHMGMRVKVDPSPWSR